MESVSDFGKTVRQRRKEIGLTQEELANKVDISRTYLSQIEQGRAKNLSFRVAEQLSSILSLESLPRVAERSKVPRGLKELAKAENLTDKQVQMLAQLEYRGKKPSSKKEWKLLHNLIKTTIESY